MTSSSDAGQRERLQRTAMAALQAGRMQEAILHFKALIPLLDPWEVETRLIPYWGLGTAYMALLRHADALSAFEEVRRVLQHAPDERLEAACLASISQTRAALGQHREAIQFGERAIASYTRLKQPLEVARWTNNLGLSYAQLESFKKARTAYESALGIAREIRARDLEAFALGNLGQLLIEDLGDVGNGVRCLEEALVLFRELQDYGSVAKTLANIGSAQMLRLGEVGKAINLLGEAQRLARMRDDKELLGRLQNLLDTAQGLLEPANLSDDEGWDFLLQLGGGAKEKERPERQCESEA